MPSDAKDTLAFLAWPCLPMGHLGGDKERGLGQRPTCQGCCTVLALAFENQLYMSSNPRLAIHCSVTLGKLLNFSDLNL